MRFVEDGKLYLDQPVSTLLDEFNTGMHKDITIFHLLTHTSGICPDPGYFMEPYVSGWWESYHNKIDKGEEASWLKAILSGPVRCKPGEGWNYSTSGFSVLGEIVSRVSGVNCEDFIIEKICRPLGMKETFFDIPEGLEHRVCVTNDWDSKRIKNEKPKTEMPPRTGGGLYSTLADLNRLAQMLLNAGTLDGVRILGRKTVEAMTKNRLSGVPAFNWGEYEKDMKMGLGLAVRLTDLLSEGTFHHEGAGRSALYVDPSERFSASFFVPTNEGWVPESLINAKSVMWSGLV